MERFRDLMIPFSRVRSTELLQDSEIVDQHLGVSKAEDSFKALDGHVGKQFVAISKRAQKAKQRIDPPSPLKLQPGAPFG